MSSIKFDISPESTLCDVLVGSGRRQRLVRMHARGFMKVINRLLITKVFLLRHSFRGSFFGRYVRVLCMHGQVDFINSHREQSVSKFLAGYETCDPWSTILLMLIVGVYKRMRTEGYFREYLQCASLLFPSKLSKSFLSHRDLDISARACHPSLSFSCP